MVGGVVLGQSIDPEDRRWCPAPWWENCQEIPEMEIPVGFDVKLVYPFLSFVQAVRRLQGHFLTVEVEGGNSQNYLHSRGWSRPHGVGEGEESLPLNRV